MYQLSDPAELQSLQAEEELPTSIPPGGELLSLHVYQIPVWVGTNFQI